MAAKRKIEVFTAGCACCDEAVALVKSVACPSCDLEIRDMKHETNAATARAYGIRTVPAVVVDGKLADCCTGRGPNESSLRAAGLGVAL